MQHVSTYNSHLQAKLRTVIALQGGCAHLGSNMAYSVLLHYFIPNVTYIYCAIVSRVKCVACAKLLVSVVLLLLELSVGVVWEWGVFHPLVLLYVSAFSLWGGCASFLVL